MHWYWCSLPYATFGTGVADDGTVVATAAINAWMRGKDWLACRRWLERRRARIEYLGRKL